MKEKHLVYKGRRQRWCIGLLFLLNSGFARGGEKYHVDMNNEEYEERHDEKICNAGYIPFQIGTVLFSSQWQCLRNTKMIRN